MTEQESEKITRRVADFIDDAIQSLVRRYGMGTSDDIQYAVRLLYSRVRRIWMEHDAQFGAPDMKLRAILGLQLNDNGELLTYANIHHTRGRLDCRACDFIYRGVCKEPQCVVCRICKNGVEHVRTVYGPAEYSGNFETLTLNAGDAMRWMVCDNCNSRTLVPVEATP